MYQRFETKGKWCVRLASRLSTNSSAYPNYGVLFSTQVSVISPLSQKVAYGNGADLIITCDHSSFPDLCRSTSIILEPGPPRDDASGSDNALLFNAQDLTCHMVASLVRGPHPKAKMTKILNEYKFFVTLLEFEVKIAVQRQLLCEFEDFEEELVILRTILRWQIRLHNAVLSVLDPTSSKTANELSIASYAFKRRGIVRGLQKLAILIARFDGLEQRSLKLRETVKEMVDSSHERAVRVFTTATVSFLPRSFVTSFIGINTSDIRNIDGGQTLFWADVIPISAALVCLSFVYAYKGDIPITKFISRLFKGRPKIHHQVIKMRC
jgi:hypothetical protein